ncbi:ribosomal RNA small subunit methyltransferase H-like isoform X1 [Mangifera indica]|uniref:ribosomal RNA small subunit methyltransferase H-like isoform X1 n=1 Tax=Mangifera indica TaxID=29780 RepID=UPI001CFA9EAD|nr:ribosomal RNA small subunit methyltransferase H-like isoform X1 [Mangifera indica]XP_044477532.1 ribosomal RNA small subunit methyltransferase H-like isoform X1 [Mangifera indica]XP_044477537.1 ribosomal RNA small subunit methyltransferase H-like isoform X1 [Mangifera indica]
MRGVKMMATSTQLEATARGAAYALLPSFLCSKFHSFDLKSVQVVKFHGKMLSKPSGSQTMLNSCTLQTNKYSRNFKFKPAGGGGSFHGFSSFTTFHATNDKKKSKKREKKMAKATIGSSAKVGLAKEKRRTRSNKEYEYDSIIQESDASHIPVMLGEVLEVFSSLRSISSFVDCTLGAAGHSSAIIRAHPELKLFIGMDVDPLAHEKARAHINSLLDAHSDLKAHIFLKNFRHIKSVLSEVDVNLANSGVDGILMDLGMSSMQVNNPKRGFSVLGNGPLDMRMDPQASLKAEDILNSWPDTELGQILQEYGEESNWRVLLKKIVQARNHGGLHSTGELVDLIRSVTPVTKGGRQGWIKTATRVFQALRIAVNNELKTLENSLYASFDCLAPGGRLAVISFHSLEDRIVKQTFLNIIDRNKEDGKQGNEDERRGDLKQIRNDSQVNELWIKQMIEGWNGTILTKRPITPSEAEERLNRRSRSAKLRVIQKA